MTAHPIPPVWNEHSRVLILGSFPSVRSREVGFFYGHPQNRFWRVLASLWEEETPVTTEEKIDFLHRRRLALWDVIASCEITGSADSAIRNASPTDIAPILAGADIRCVCTNGGTAASLYRKYQASAAPALPHIALPSTSPANAAWNLDRLCETWHTVKLYADT